MQTSDIWCGERKVYNHNHFPGEATKAQRMTCPEIRQAGSVRVETSTTGLEKCHFCVPTAVWQATVVIYHKECNRIRQEKYLA